MSIRSSRRVAKSAYREKRASQKPSDIISRYSSKPIVSGMNKTGFTKKNHTIEDLSAIIRSKLCQPQNTAYRVFGTSKENLPNNENKKEAEHSYDEDSCEFGLK
jgi:hypothetical protein